MIVSPGVASVLSARTVHGHVRIGCVVSSFVAEITRRLPRGWAHLALQIVIWMGFTSCTRLPVAQPIAASPTLSRTASGFSVPSGDWGRLRAAIQRVVDTSSILVTLTSFTYWLSQFAVVGLTLLWVYLRRHERFAGFRNWLIVANLVGLVGASSCRRRLLDVPRVGRPTRLCTFADQPRQRSHRWASNLSAAMPSLHAMDAWIVGIVMFGLVRSRLAKALWLAWPAWVAFAVISTGNHYWLDVVAGFALAVATDSRFAGLVRRAWSPFRQCLRPSRGG